MTHIKSAVATRCAAMAAVERLETLINLTGDDDVFLHETMKSARQVITNSGITGTGNRFSVIPSSRPVRH